MDILWICGVGFLRLDKNKIFYYSILCVYKGVGFVSDRLSNINFKKY